MDAAKRQGLEKKRLSLYLAASDMDLAAAAAEALAAETQDAPQDIRPTDIESGRSAGSSQIGTSDGIAHTTYSEGWCAFPREWIPALVGLCRRQAQGFRQEAARIDAQLLSL
jgi:hypothetical protein